MTIQYDKLKQWPFETVRQTYDWRDAALYALGVGYGFDPMDTRQLPYVYEGPDVAGSGGAPALQTVPTMAVVLATPGFWVKDPASGVDWVKVLHGEQNLEIHRPLPAGGTVTSTTRVERIVDKGAGKGALLVQVRDLTDADSGQLLATLESITFCRGDGGYSAQPGNGPAGGDAPPTPRPKVPDSPPDTRCELPTLPQAALIYRLCADLNPLHADPAVAKAAGFERPILHGLAS
ncbi:MAG: MaoC/PaaZ C-terminal domain-containing protein [Burkholderiaceae bacterium]